MFPHLNREQQLHNLLFLLETAALAKLDKITAAGFTDFVREGKGVYSASLDKVLRDLRKHNLVQGFSLTGQGKEVFRNISSLLLYDGLYQNCLVVSECFERDLSLIDKDIADNLLVRRSKPGERIKLEL